MHVHIFYCPLWAEALRWADFQAEEVYQMGCWPLSPVFSLYYRSFAVDKYRSQGKLLGILISDCQPFPKPGPHSPFFVNERAARL